MISIWNEVVEDGIAFPKTDRLDAESGKKFFAAQTYNGGAEVDGEVIGLYILHPNSIGRCGYIHRERELRGRVEGARASHRRKACDRLS